jgi:hypothetical protein
MLVLEVWKIGFQKDGTIQLSLRVCQKVINRRDSIYRGPVRRWEQEQEAVV